MTNQLYARIESNTRLATAPQMPARRPARRPFRQRRARQEDNGGATGSATGDGVPSGAAIDTASGRQAREGQGAQDAATRIEPNDGSTGCQAPTANTAPVPPRTEAQSGTYATRPAMEEGAVSTTAPAAGTVSGLDETSAQNEITSRENAQRHLGSLPTGTRFEGGAPPENNLGQPPLRTEAEGRNAPMPSGNTGDGGEVVREEQATEEHPLPPPGTLSRTSLADPLGRGRDWRPGLPMSTNFRTAWQDRQRMAT